MRINNEYKLCWLIEAPIAIIIIVKDDDIEMGYSSQE